MKPKSQRAQTVAPEGTATAPRETPMMPIPEPSAPESGESPDVPVALVPTPTRAYRWRRKTRRASLAAGTPVRTPIPAPPIVGARVLMWKWDAAASEVGIRTAFLPGHVLVGPRDARIVIDGLPPVTPNVMGDLIAAPGTDAFDAIHTFAVVRQTLTMYQHALFPTSLPWQWNGRENTEPIRVFPRAGESMNAFYSRKDQALKFFSFTPPGGPASAPPIHTCRSQDLVAHETGHAILDGLKPDWLSEDKPPQTGALHEAFADLTAIFLALSRPESVAALVTQTKANLHNKTYLGELVDESGLALGRPTGLSNVDNELTLGQVGTEVHDLGQVFTGAVYDVLADVVAFEVKQNLDPTSVAYTSAQYICSLLIRAVTAAPDSAASFADVVNQMLKVAELDEKPVQYRNFIRDRFALREVVVSPTPRTGDHKPGQELEANVRDAPDAVQTRHACCGTLQHPQYTGEDTVAPEIEEFLKGLSISATGRKR